MNTSPPRPPSPPLGPPRGTNFSRRNARQPLPPSPAFTRIFTSSMNMNQWPVRLRIKMVASGQFVWEWEMRLFRRFDADELAETAAIAKLDHARDLREQRVVLAQSDVLSGFDTRAALADDDRTAGDQLSAERFHAKPLSIGIAPVFRTA